MNTTENYNLTKQKKIINHTLNKYKLK